MNKTKTRDTTALIKDLELQIDYLIGYAPQGNHWKQEYHIRKELLDNTLCDLSTPQDVVDKINRIQDSVYRLQNYKKHEQDYITYSMLDYVIDRPLLVNDRKNNTSYYI